MKKLAVIGLICGVGCAVILLVRKRQSSEPLQEREERREKKRRAMFQKIQEGMEAMPQDFPPVVMFDNVAAIRENSEQLSSSSKRIAAVRRSRSSQRPSKQSQIRDAPPVQTSCFSLWPPWPLSRGASLAAD